VAEEVYGRRFTVEELSGRVVAALLRSSVPEEDARTVAACLLAAELEGQTSHGLVRLPLVVRRLRSGLINARPRMRVHGTQPAAAVLDADNALGPVAGARAVDLAVERARSCGVGVVAVRHSNHLGSLGFYLHRFLVQGMAGLCFSNTPPAMAPPGTGTPLVGTNPIAAGFPGRDGPVLVDMATSQVARGRILAARRAGRPIPEGWAIDVMGLPTTDPEAAIRGSLVPLGGDKGFALALLVELLSGVLAGAGVGPDVSGTFEDSDRESDVGHSFWALDPGAFGDGFAGRVERLAAGIHELGGRLPGERRHAERERRQADGVELPGPLVAELRELAETMPDNR